MELLNGVFSLAHIIYIILNIILITLGNIVVKKKKVDEKILQIILKVSAVFLLISVTTMRINDVIIHHQNWWNVLPNTICSSSSFILSLTILFGKKDNKVLHYVIYMALFGGVVSTIYPDYLEKSAFFSVDGITSLLHHSIDIWICTVCLFNAYIIPEYKKIKYFIMGYCYVILFGLFCITGLNIEKSMNVNEPLLSSMPFMTSWWMLLIVCIPFVLLFIFLFRKYQGLDKKKEEENIMTEDSSSEQ